MVFCAMVFILYSCKIIMQTAGIKRSVMNEEYSLLWHQRLGHISIQRIKRLVNEGVLRSLDFTCNALKILYQFYNMFRV